MNHPIERLRQRLHRLTAGPAPAAVPTLSISLTIPLPLTWPLRRLLPAQGAAWSPGLHLALGRFGLMQLGTRYGAVIPYYLPGRLQRLHIPSRARTTAELQRVARLASHAILPPLTLEVRPHYLLSHAGVRPAVAARRPLRAPKPAPRLHEVARRLSLRPWSLALAAQCRRLLQPMRGLALPAMASARTSGRLRVATSVL